MDQTVRLFFYGNAHNNKLWFYKHVCFSTSVSMFRSELKKLERNSIFQADISAVMIASCWIQRWTIIFSRWLLSYIYSTHWLRGRTSSLCYSDINLYSRDRHVLQLQQHTTTSHLIQNTRQSEKKKTFNNRLNSLHNTCCNRLQVFPFIIFILTYLYSGAVRQFFIRHVEKHFQPSYKNLLSLLLESPSAFGTRPCLHFERHDNISSISLRKLK